MAKTGIDKPTDVESAAHSTASRREGLNMAVDYIGANNGVFRHLGKIVKHYIAQRADAIALSADQLDIADAIALMTAGDPDQILDGFDSIVAGWQANVVSWRAALIDLATTRLQDQATILDEIGAVSFDSADLLSKLVTRMNLDAETVLKSTVTLGANSADPSNTGNGSIVKTTILDGVTSPGAGAVGTFASHPEYRGLLSQLAVTSETMRLECITDSFVGSVAEGAEVWRWTGRKRDEANGFGNEGSGEIGNVVSLHGQSAILQNADFEDWSAGVLDSWDLVAGTFGSTITQETTDAFVYHGESAIAFNGNGVAASMELKQGVANALVTANKMYCVSARVMGAVGLAAGTLTIQFEGTGYSAGASEKISLDHTALAAIGASYSLQHFFVIMPDIIPSDFRLVIRYNGTPENGKTIRVDDVGFNAASYGGGIAVAIIRGSTPWVRNDRVDFTVANDDDGEFQKFFRQAFGIQLPSDDSGSETIPDTLIA